MTRTLSSHSVALLLMLPLAVPAHAQLTTNVVSVDVRPGVTMRYLATSDAGPPKAAVILFAGGNGVLNLSPLGVIGSNLEKNFLIRSRDKFARQGLFVVALDAASDNQSGMNGNVRNSRQHAQDIEKILADVMKRTGVPVWLIGTSTGTMSTASAAAHLAQSPSRPHGIVLTSTQTVLVVGYCGMTVYDVLLSKIKGPVLIVSHRDDGCACSPGGAAAGAKLLSALSGAGAKFHQMWEGGDPPRSAPCNALSPHGYLGIEDKVVKSIADWIEIN